MGSDRVADDIVWQSFPSLEDSTGVLTAVSTRSGGVSSDGLTSLNLSASIGDHPENVAENRRRFLDAVGVSDRQVVISNQVHSDDIAIIGDLDSRPGQYRSVGAADGLLTATPGIALSMTFADCVPLLVVDPVHGVIGLAHAGWRGTFANIAGKLVATMVTHYNTNPPDIVAAIGPSIGQCCYTVGADLIARARSDWPWGETVLCGRRLDLGRANVNQLVDAGLKRELIDLTATCTACENATFFSHRAQAGAAGRFAALISLGTG